MNETRPDGQPTGEGTAPVHPAAEAGGSPATGATGGNSAAPAGAAPPPEQVIEILRAENAELRDRVLRAHAEMENIRKRTERERADAQKYALTKFAREIVGVGDNLQRAIDAVPADAVAQVPALKSFLDGVTMTDREFISVLEKNGVKRIDPKGQPFNPHHHQAVMEQPNPDVPSGTVTQVFQPGYLIEDRILRPAMVVVARGGFKPVREPASPAAAAAPEPPAADDDNPGGNGTAGNGQTG